MTSQPYVRVIPVDDKWSPVAVELLNRFFVEEGFREDVAAIENNFEQLNADPHHWSALGIARDDRAIGVVTATTMLFVEWGRLGEIGDLYVVPEHRGKGVATRLVAAATSWCRSLGCSAVSVTITPEGQATRKLSEFYASLGFLATGRTTSTLDFSKSSI